jgi:esterase/lipase superfamily enzyme
MGFDLSIRGVMALFSWPSQGQTKSYFADEAAIEASEQAIYDFFVKIAAHSGARQVHIIAHSMGNRGVLRAVSRIADEARKQAPKRFGQVILAAPDVDVDVFRHRYAAYLDVARRTTLYVSERDVAVGFSEWLHDYPRVGLMPPVFVADGIDTINVAGVDVTGLGHGYVAQARGILQDIHALLAYGPPPSQRFGLRPVVSDEGGRFWSVA